MYQSKVLRMLGGQRSVQKSPRKKNILSGLIAFLSLFFILMSVIMAVTTAGVFAYVDSLIPEDLNIEPFSQSTYIYDRTGQILLYELSGDERRISVTFDEVPRHIVNATIALEDKKFYDHKGYDTEGILRAAWTGVGGGSTITQQIVKRVFLTPEKSYERKLKELLIAIRIEQKYSKEEIMAAYLNQIFYGEQAYGIKAASERYFNKDLSEITLAEAAILVGIPQRPNMNNPFSGEKKDLVSELGVNIDNPENWRHQKYLAFAEQVELSNDFEGAEESVPEVPENNLLEPSLVPDEGVATVKQVISSWRQRQIQTLDLMIEQGFITLDEAETALAQELKFERSQIDIRAPHFIMNKVIPELEARYGEKKIREGGLTVITTLDMDLQNEAERIVVDQINRIRAPYNARNGAMVAMDPKTGEILAHVGSVNYFDESNDGNVDVATSLRQPGSSFKPFAYAAALENGYHPETVVADIKTCFGRYCPRNYDGRFHGPVTLRSGLANSYNIPAIKAVHMGGITATEELALKMGVDGIEGRGLECGLAFSLGCAETTIYDMVEGYATFANLGKRRDSAILLKVIDQDGTILHEHNPQVGEEVIDPATAYIIADILSDNNARMPAFGPRSDLVVSRRAAAKTGTTNDIKDNWTLGFTPDIVVGVWVGNNNGDPMSGRASGLTGAAPIWNAFMEVAFTKIPETPWFSPPATLSTITVDAMTGWAPNPENELGSGDIKQSMILQKFSNSLRIDDQRIILEIDTTNGLLANKATPDNLREKKSFWKIKPAIAEGDPAYGIWNNSLQAFVNAKCASNPLDIYCIPTEESRNYYTDDGKPLVKILSHSSGQTITTSDFQIRAEAASPWPITKVEFFLDGNRVEVFNTEQSVYWYDFSASDGSHTIEVKATDEQGVTGSSSISIQINTKLTIAIVSPTNSSTLKSTVPISIAVNAPAGVKEVQIFVDGNKQKTLNNSPYETTLNLSDGNRTIKAVVIDDKGKSENDSVTITIDSQAPPAFSLSGNCDIAIGDSCILSASPDDNPGGSGIAYTELYMIAPSGEVTLLQNTDGSSTTYIFDPTTAGNHKFYVKAFDYAGNSRQTDNLEAIVTN